MIYWDEGEFIDCGKYLVSAYGLKNFKLKPPARKCIVPTERQILACMKWLGLCRVQKSITNNATCSYTLKHIIEESGFIDHPHYIPNGAVIVAAHRLGIPFTPTFFDGPNAGISVFRKDVQLLEEKFRRETKT